MATATTSEMKAKANSNYGALAESVGEQAGMYASQTVDQAKAMLKSSRQYVEQNPQKSVAIAAAAGAFFGSLVTMALFRRH